MHSRETRLSPRLLGQRYNYTCIHVHYTLYTARERLAWKSACAEPEGGAVFTRGRTDARYTLRRRDLGKRDCWSRLR